MNFVEYMLLADVLGSLKIVSIIICGIFLLALSFVGFVYIDTPSYDRDEIKKYKKLIISFSIVAIVSLAIFTITPSKKTMYIVAGASAAKEFSQSDVSTDMKDLIVDLKTIVHNYAEPK